MRKNDCLFCTGSLISYKDVLTAAQCVNEIRKLNSNINSRGLAVLINERKYEISSLKSHPGYENKVLTHANSFDLGIIKVSFQMCFCSIINEENELLFYIYSLNLNQSNFH